MSFHNPYHFVPVAKPDELRREDDVSRVSFEKGRPPHLRHDRYAPDTFSGRIQCRMVCETPVFVGNLRIREATDRTPAHVEPFCLDNQPAIPSSSLRGVISSIAEAASNSALRVLDNRTYSYRMSMEESLSAIGMVSKHGERDKYWLQPLTLPTVRASDRPDFRPLEWCSKMFPEPNLKVYFGTRKEIGESGFLNRFQTHVPARGDYYGLQLHKMTWSNDGLISAPCGALHWTERGGGRSLFLLSQNPLSKSPREIPKPVPWDQVKSDPSYTRGILRVLGCGGRPDIPNTKKHEIFIPYPKEMEDLEEPWQRFPIAEEAIARFHDLADERTKSREEGAALPYEPHGTSRSEKESSREFRLKTGDLVYFQANNEGTEVVEISLSSIWRSRVEDNEQKTAARTFDFFGDVDPDLMPFNEQRQDITAAEQLFGFVEERADGEGRSDRPSLTLAGRVRFSHALLSAQDDADDPEGSGTSPDECYLPAVTLRILSAPKPPSPSLYFKWRSGERKPVLKRQMNRRDHEPQGRKFYLHQPADNEPWASRRTNPDSNESRLKQKVEIRPMRQGTSFDFHIDFDNLTRRELALLAYALRPSQTFRHKIGMGKPLGLGTVRIDPLTLQLVDRHGRYTLSGLLAERYSGSWTRPSGTTKRTSEEEGDSRATAPNLTELAGEYRSQMNLDIRNALDLIGDTQCTQQPVHYPAVRDRGAVDLESELFEWFVANEALENEGDFLVPLTGDTRRMPTLRYHSPKRGRR